MRPVAGGMWRHLETLVEEMGDEFEYVVACQDDPEQLERLSSRGLRARIVEMPPTIEPIADLRAARQLRRVIGLERPALVHSHNIHAGLLTSLVCLVTGRPPHVSTLHSIFVRPDVTGIKAALYRLLGRLYASTTAYIICVSREIAQELPPRAARRVTLIPNGIGRGQVTPAIGRSEALERLGAGEGERILGYVGRLAPEKGVAYLLRMLAILRDERVRLVIVGDGPCEQDLRELTTDLGLDDRVVFTGFHAPVADYLQVFDLVVLPSIFEGLPLAVIEALAMGVPVVATAVGALPDVISDEVGALVPPEDPEALAKAVSDLLGSDRLAGMSLRGKELVAREYTSAAMVTSTLAVYEGAMGRRRPQ